MFQKQARIHRSDGKELPNYSRFLPDSIGFFPPSISLMLLDRKFLQSRHPQWLHEPYRSPAIALEYCPSLLVQYIVTENVQAALRHFELPPSGIDLNP